MLTVETVLNATPEQVWRYWTEPEHVTKWCQASDDWHAPSAANDLRMGGKFKTVMAARDGSAAFDFEGTYTVVEHPKKIEYAMSDGRKVVIAFLAEGNATKVIESFDPEDENSLDMQKDGWQSILNNFKKYVESQK